MHSQDGGTSRGRPTFDCLGRLGIHDSMIEKRFHAAALWLPVCCDTTTINTTINPERGTMRCGAAALWLPLRCDTTVLQSTLQPTWNTAKPSPQQTRASSGFRFVGIGQAHLKPSHHLRLTNIGLQSEQASFHQAFSVSEQSASLFLLFNKQP